MVGLILLYFVGKAFYDLAGLHGKGQWLYAILGVISYYAGLVIGSILIAIVYEVYLEISVENLNEFLLGLMALPFGVLACWGFYRGLKSRWESPKAYSGDSDNALDSTLIDRNSDRHNSPS